MDLTEQQAKYVPATQRKRLLHSYPVIAQHFSHRFNLFMKFIPNENSKPIGEVLVYFRRIEFQQRGSSHIHSQWVEDAPNLCTVEDKRDTLDHIHTQTCRKQCQFSRRFDFPMRANTSTHLKCNRDIGNSMS